MTMELIEVFALYLRAFPDVTVTFNGTKLDPTPAIHQSQEFVLSDVNVEGLSYSTKIEIIEWNTEKDRLIYLCDSGVNPKFWTRYPSNLSGRDGLFVLKFILFRRHVA